MTPIEFKTHMQKISKNVMELDDQNQDMPSMIEKAHIQADELMCQILTDLGYGEGIDLFKKMEKYYVWLYELIKIYHLSMMDFYFDNMRKYILQHWYIIFIDKVRKKVGDSNANDIRIKIYSLFHLSFSLLSLFVLFK